MAGINQLSASERARVKFHLGYPSVGAFASIQIGFIAVSQPLYLVEKSMDNLLDEAVPLLREHVMRLDKIHQQLDDARGRFRAAEVDEIRMNADEATMLHREYKYWATSMADLLGCPINAYAEKFNGGFGLSPLSLPVVQ